MRTTRFRHQLRELHIRRMMGTWDHGSASLATPPLGDNQAARFAVQHATWHTDAHAKPRAHAQLLLAQGHGQEARGWGGHTLPAASATHLPRGAALTTLRRPLAKVVPRQVVRKLVDAAGRELAAP